MVGVLHEDGHDAEVSDAGLAALGRLVGCDIAALNRVEYPQRRIVGAVTDPPEHYEVDKALFDSLAHQHPGFAAYESGRLAPGSSVALTDLAELSALRRIPLYADVFRPRGTVDQLVCLVRADGRRGSSLSFNRSRAGFSDRDRAVVELVAPHLARAMACRDRLAAARKPDPGLSRPAWWLELTPRERQVAEQVSRGTTDRQIARHLEISPRTVHKHLEQIYRKLGLPNRASLIALSFAPPSSGR
ncbi:MAG TPA: helix-turn-helix transcriptional regulator [Actinophytocola sp.]|uniref:helix-turn-helix transcriptional regulator n=1 Tax=Actinophytocola sp. TaxID=1872138 RepID=UPI002DBEB1AC|nr:helix-turn-helix transcriptional regulator [Actinophytocola sp.]HEU5474385.1 helix-turn-helix transcriptional regulator [Actinophytocola sp.]